MGDAGKEDPDLANWLLLSAAPTPTPKLGGPLSASHGYDEKLRRWEDHKRSKARKKSNEAPTYGMMVKSKIASNDLDDSIEDALRKRDLLVRNIQSLAQGSFARVYTGTWTRPGDAGDLKVAIKVMRFQRDPNGDDGVPRWLKREIEVQHSQQHENLLSVCHASLQEEPFIIMLEFCAGGALSDVLQSSAKAFTGPRPRVWRFSWAQRMKTCLDVAAGMLHLHNQRLIHRDLKPQNILLLQEVDGLETEPHAKVCDFGMARAIAESGKTDNVMTATVGSWVYMAPEIMNSGSYDEKVDVWSYAMVLYECITELTPFANTSARNCSGLKLGLHLLQGLRPLTTSISPETPDIMMSIMIRSWSAEACNRPSFSQVLEELQAEYGEARATRSLSLGSEGGGTDSVGFKPWDRVKTPVKTPMLSASALMAFDEEDPANSTMLSDICERALSDISERQGRSLSDMTERLGTKPEGQDEEGEDAEDFSEAADIEPVSEAAEVEAPSQATEAEGRPPTMLSTPSRSLGGSCSECLAGVASALRSRKG